MSIDYSTLLIYSDGVGMLAESTFFLPSASYVVATVALILQSVVPLSMLSSAKIAVEMLYHSKEKDLNGNAGNVRLKLNIRRYNIVSLQTSIKMSNSLNVDIDTLAI